MIVSRPDEEIVDSILNRTPWMNKHGLNKEQWLDWVRHMRKRTNELLNHPETDCCFIDSEKFVNKDYSQLRYAIEYAGLTWNEKKVEKLIKEN